MSKEIDKLEILTEVCKEYDVSFSGVESNAIIAAMDKWHEVVNKNDLLPRVVCSTWIFFYEGEKDKPQFKVQANTQWEAYQVAEETYGPQVEDMMYCMI